MTPVRNPQTNAEQCYSAAHAFTRAIDEQAISPLPGLLKTRAPVPSELGVQNSDCLLCLVQPRSKPGEKSEEGVMDQLPAPSEDEEDGSEGDAEEANAVVSSTLAEEEMPQSTGIQRLPEIRHQPSPRQESTLCGNGRKQDMPEEHLLATVILEL
eukprot:g35675.t1